MEIKKEELSTLFIALYAAKFPLNEDKLSEIAGSSIIVDIMERIMSNAEYAALESSGGLSHMAGKELFVSSSEKYSRDMMLRHPEKYDVLVRFKMKPGAMNYFNQVGVMYRTASGSIGWISRGNLLWKSEGGVMNLGIQQNTHMFNPWINNFKVIK